MGCNFDLNLNVQGAESLNALKSALESLSQPFENINESAELLNTFVTGLNVAADEANEKLAGLSESFIANSESIKALSESLSEALILLQSVPSEKSVHIAAFSPELTALKDIYDSITDKTVTVSVNEASVQSRRWGGVIHGALSGYGGGDRVKAMLEPGEFVVRKEAVSRFGLGFFQSVNSLKLPQSQTTATGSLKRFEINIGGAELKGLSSENVLRSFETKLRRMKLTGGEA
jgi:hypothetical protein